jgi:molybdopterin synthase sulfur carrier subunit
MRLTIRYFASIREALGSTEVLEVEAPLTLGQLRDRLIARGGAHAEALARGRLLRAAVNQVMADESMLLRADGEIAFFPPVTGG